jgi:ribosomal-protein-alanine N-acetyltransferase
MRATFRIDAMTEGDVPAAEALQEATQLDAAQLREELTRPWARVWVACEEPRDVVALLVAWHVSDELHVLNVATRADRRRRGAARSLMDTMVAYARVHGIRHVLLEVRRSNRAAIALYRALGFFAMGIRARYYPDDEDAIEMVLTLDPATGAVVPHADEIRIE